MIKKNLKMYFVFLLGVICAVGITFAYTVSSKNIAFKQADWNVKNVEEAVDYLKDENSCVGLKPEPIVAHVTSGDKNTVGSIVQIGNEEFYVIGQGTGDETGKTKLLAKYTLKDNNQVSSGATGVNFSETNYWSNKSLNYNNNPYVYDSNSNLYNIINDYADKIKKLGVKSVSGRVMTVEEANALSINIRKSVGYSHYWLGAAANDNYVWHVRNDGDVNCYAYNFPIGVRPLILIPTNKIG